MRLLTLLILTLSLGASPDNRELWIVEQEVLKLGKKEIYEHAKEGWFEEFDQFAKQDPPTIIGVDDTESDQYFYLIPIQNFSEIDAYRKLLKEFRFTLPPEKWIAKELLLASVMGARFASIYQYKPECSGSPPPFTPSLKLKITLYSVAQGQEEPFEHSLIQKSVQAFKEKKPQTWRVFKLLYGSNLPKYLICTYGEESFDLIDGSLQELVVREKSVQGVVRPELSLGLSTN